MAVTKVAADGTRKVLKKKPVEGVVKKTTASRKKVTPTKEEAPPPSPGMKVEEVVEAPIILPPPTPYVDKWAGLLDDKRLDKRGIYRHTRYLAFTIGFDPEVFVRDTNGVFTPAWDPKVEVPTQTASNTMYRDGFAVEFKAGTPNPSTPMYCHEYGVTSIYRGLNNIRKHLGYRGYVPVLEDFVEIPPEILENASPEDVRLGCSPSINAYGDNPVLPDNGRILPFRTAGFHYHIGVRTGNGSHFKEWFDGEEEYSEIMNHCIKLMDFGHVALTALMGDREDKRRRTLYGRAGEYRLPDYGLEYRVFSNVIMRDPRWVFFALDMTRWFFKNYIMTGTKSNLYYGTLASPTDVPWDEVRGIINESDQAGACKFITDARWRSFYDSAVRAMYFKWPSIDKLITHLRNNLKPKGINDWNGWATNGIVASNMTVASSEWYS